jgi:hypothetical protein
MLISRYQTEIASGLLRDSSCRTTSSAATPHGRHEPSPKTTCGGVCCSAWFGIRHCTPTPYHSYPQSVSQEQSLPSVSQRQRRVSLQLSEKSVSRKLQPSAQQPHPTLYAHIQVSDRNSIWTAWRLKLPNNPAQQPRRHRDNVSTKSRRAAGSAAAPGSASSTTTNTIPQPPTKRQPKTTTHRASARNTHFQASA